MELLSSKQTAIIPMALGQVPPMRIELRWWIELWNQQVARKQARMLMLIWRNRLEMHGTKEMMATFLLSNASERLLSVAFRALEGT
jgi:hypothetical protein